MPIMINRGRRKVSVKDSGNKMKNMILEIDTRTLVIDGKVVAKWTIEVEDTIRKGLHDESFIDSVVDMIADLDVDYYECPSSDSIIKNIKNIKKLLHDYFSGLQGKLNEKV